MSTTILGKGLSFPYHFRHGHLLVAEAEASVEAAVRMLFATRVGERFMLPQYGSHLPHLLFEPCDSITAHRLEVYAVEAIRRWIPRIRRVSARATPIPADHMFRVEIEYELINSPTPRTFIYPFYLQST